MASESSLSTLIRILISPDYTNGAGGGLSSLGVGGGWDAERLRGYANLEIWDSV